MIAIAGRFAHGLLVQLRSRPYLVAAFVLFVILLYPTCRRTQSDWENVYLPAANHLVQGEHLFQEGFAYPPVNAYLGLPVLGLPAIPARIAWLAVNVACLMGVIAFAWRIAGGQPWNGTDPIERREATILALGLGCGIYFAFDVLTNQQTDLLVAFLVVAGCLILLKGWSLRAGVLFGLAAGIKCTPLLFAGYLLWRRHWLAALAVPLVAVSVNLLPDWTHPSAESAATPRLVQWARAYLVPMTDQQRDAGTWAAAITFNHSLAGLSNRLLIQQRPEPGQLGITVREDRLSPSALKAVVHGIGLLLITIAVACSWIGARSPDSSTDLCRYEFGLVLILMLLLCPHSSKPHFCTLLLPGFCLARAVVVARRPVLAGLLGAAILCGLISNKDLVGRGIYDLALWYGSVTWTALFLFAGCCGALISRPKPAPAVVVHDEPLTRAA